MDGTCDTYWTVHVTKFIDGAAVPLPYCWLLDDAAPEVHVRAFLGEGDRREAEQWVLLDLPALQDRSVFLDLLIDVVLPDRLQVSFARAPARALFIHFDDGSNNDGINR